MSNLEYFLQKEEENSQCAILDIGKCLDAEDNLTEDTEFSPSTNVTNMEVQSTFADDEKSLKSNSKSDDSAIASEFKLGKQSQEPKGSNDQILSFMATEESYSEDSENRVSQIVKTMDDCESTNSILSEIIDMNVAVVSSESPQTKERLDGKKGEEPLIDASHGNLHTNSTHDSTRNSNEVLDSLTSSKTINEILSDFCDDTSDIITSSELKFCTTGEGENSKTEALGNQSEVREMVASECSSEKNTEGISEKKSMEVVVEGTKENCVNKGDKEECMETKNETEQNVNENSEEIDKVAPVKSLADAEIEVEIDTVEKNNEMAEEMKDGEEVIVKDVENNTKDKEVNSVQTKLEEGEMETLENNTEKMVAKNAEENHDFEESQRNDSNENARGNLINTESDTPDNALNVKERPASAIVRVKKIEEKPEIKDKLENEDAESKLNESKTDLEEINHKKLKTSEDEDMMDPLKGNDRDLHDKQEDVTDKSDNTEDIGSDANREEAVQMQLSPRDPKVNNEIHTNQYGVELSGSGKEIFEGSNAHTIEEMDKEKLKNGTKFKDKQLHSGKHQNEELSAIIVTTDVDKSIRNAHVDYDEENIENISNTIKSFANESPLSKKNDKSNQKPDVVQPKRVIMVKTASNVERVKRKLEEILDKSKGEEDAAIAELQRMKKEKTDILNAITSEMEKLKSMLVKGKQG